MANVKDLLKQSGIEPLSSNEEKAIEDSITRSRIQMLMHFPFFGILSLNLKMQMDYTVPTAATDGNSFFYNPYFMKELKESEKNWVVVHEVLHPALKHLWRRGDRQHKKWNYACDYAIHDIMMQFINNADYKIKDKLTMPADCLYDPKFKDMSAEQIYDLLPEMQEDEGQGQGGQGQGGKNGKNGKSGQPGLLDSHDKWEEQQAQQNGQVKAQDWEGKMVSAAQSAEGKMAGSLPGFLKRLIGKITSPQKNWKSLLAEFVEPEIDDYSFNPPDRRYSNSDFFLPDFNDETQTVKKMLFWIDTSGSIGDKELTACYSEIVGAINQFSGKLSGHVGFFDSEAYAPESFENVTEVLKIKPQGGGGTSFHAPLEYTKEHFEHDEVSGIIILTDGWASWPPEKLANGVPVLWIVTDETQVPPWGLKTTLKI